MIFEKKIEKEVVCLISVSGVRILFNISGELGKVSLSSVSAVLVAFITCGGSGKVWLDDVYDVWSTFFSILKESRPWVAFLFINMFCLISSLTTFSIKVLFAFEASVLMT